MYNGFIFFSGNDTVLFHRNDAETAEWTHQEFSLSCTFPYDPDKVITRGMRIGFDDSWGQFQLFEIRNVTDSEPDHTQEIVAEHIIISELTDCHLVKYAPEDIVNAQTAVNAVLAGTGWTLGTCTSEATHKPEISMTSVWSALTTIRDLYGLRLEPYVTVSETEITGRYLNIVDNVGVWRGVRIAINKNIDQVGVTYDDSTLITAVYGYGAGINETYEAPSSGSSTSDDSSGDSSGSSSGDNVFSNSATRSTETDSNTDSESTTHSTSSTESETDYGADYVTIKNVVWEQTDEHPAKPDGQLYLEDPEATALYGRNGRPRFGFYSNSDVDDPEELIALCWEALQRQNKPSVTVDCTISELQSMGMEGEQIRVGDTVRVEIEPLGVVLELMCICLTENLLDPTQTHPTIGKYIKDIVYITKEQETAAGGGGGGGGGGGENKEEIEQEKSIYTVFDRTDEYILMQAVNIESVEGALNTAYSEIYQNATEITAEVTRATGAEETLSSNISINADAITAEVTRAGNAESALQLTLDGITMTSAGVITIKGQTVNLGDYVTIANLEANYATIDGLDATNGIITNLRSGQASFSGLNCTGVISAGNVVSSGGFTTNSGTFDGHTISIPNVNSATFLGLGDLDLGHYHSISCSASGGQVTITLGAAQATEGSDFFNIADTQFYQDGVSAAETRGADSVTLSSAGWVNGSNVVTGSSSYFSGNPPTFTVSLPTFSVSGDGAIPSGSTSKTVYFSTSSVTGSLAHGTVDATQVIADAEAAGAASVTIGITSEWLSLNDENTLTIDITKSGEAYTSLSYEMKLGFTSSNAYVNVNSTRRLVKALPFSTYSGTPLYTLGPGNTPQRYTGTLYEYTG